MNKESIYEHVGTDRIALEPGWPDNAAEGFAAPFKPVDPYAGDVALTKRDMFLGKCDAILADVRYKHWTICAYPDLDGPTAYLQVTFHAPDWSKERPGYANPAVLQSGRKWRLSEHMTKSEIVQTALMAVLAAEEHENREQFLYKGRAIFGPHFDVDGLHDICGREGFEDVRPVPIAADVLIARCETAKTGRWAGNGSKGFQDVRGNWASGLRFGVDPSMS